MNATPTVRRIIAGIALGATLSVGVALPASAATGKSDKTTVRKVLDINRKVLDINSVQTGSRLPV